MSQCSVCQCELESHQIRTASNDEIYCEECFSENYNYCNRCDEVISRDETQWDDEGDPLCSSCYENMHDDDSPDNPHVYDSDRKLILELSRSWLSDRSNHKSLLKINKNDFLLQKIRDSVGLVDNPIYLFGLIDRDEYQLSVSPNLMEEVKDFILINGLELKIIEGIGSNRIGISYSLRKDHLPTVIKLIKQITEVKELALA
ncbi:MAG: hypothetical protein KF816_02955 [Melioribacteraceae bacterium]|nr:hypothetical protein [Melioribacteraceae bacterium]